MLTIYRRHVKSCQHRSQGRKYRRCRCPIWADGFLNGVEMRESMQVRDWEKAQQKIREWEVEGEKVQEKALVTVQQACEEFLIDAEARKLKEPTLYKYRLLFDGPRKKQTLKDDEVRSEGLKEFAAQNGIRFLKELDISIVRRFRASWKDGNIAALKKLERLRAFFRFAQESGWVTDNPTKRLKNPSIAQPPTLPFTREQMSQILAACQRYRDNCQRSSENVVF